MTKTEEWTDTTKKLETHHGFFVVSQALLAILQPREALILSYLMNFEAFQEKHRRTEDGWFKCSQDIIISKLHLSTWGHRAGIQALVDNGYLEWEMRGNPAKRWLRINYTVVNEDIEYADEV